MSRTRLKRFSVAFRPVFGSGETHDSGKNIEPRIETRYLLDSILLHDGEMDAVTCGEMAISQNDLFRLFYYGMINRQHLIHDREQRVESRLDGVAAIDGAVSVQDLLKHFGVGDQSLTFCHQFFYDSLHICLVRMRCANKINRNIRVDQNHECSPLP